MKKIKYYSLDKIFKKSANSDFYMIIGQRGNGKTVSCLEFVLRAYKKNKRRFCYVRRWDEDVKAYRAEQLFNTTYLQSVISELFGPDIFIQYYRHKYYLVNENGTKIDCIGYVLSLSASSHTKSIAYNGVSYILFDEFVQMAGERQMPDEMSKWENTLSTILRGDNITCGIKPIIFMCANTVSKFSPYFIHYGIDINKVEQGEIITKEIPLNDAHTDILKITLEYCEFNEDIGKTSSRYAQSNMIRSGRWEIPETDDIPACKNEQIKEQLLFTIFEDQANVIVGCFLHRSKWYTIESDEKRFLYYRKAHRREFLVLRTIETKSNYFHLSTEKALNYHTYNDINLMLADIKEQTEIDFEHELYMGRVFCDNMFTADYFNNSWIRFGCVSARSLL